VPRSGFVQSPRFSVPARRCNYLARQPELAEVVSVQSSTFRLEPYGWGVSPHRPELRAAVDRALMRRVRSTEWRFVVQEYMGSGSISPE
jgi:ABC-type amino acid transport substrate-binding protein